MEGLLRGSHKSGNQETTEEPDSEEWRECVEAATFLRDGEPKEPAVDGANEESVSCESPSAKVEESESSSRSGYGGNEK